MRNFRFVLLPVIAAYIGLANAAYGADAKRAEWSHLARIEVSKMRDKGVVEFALTPEVHDLAQPDLSDLRVVTDAGDEVAYVTRVAERKEQSLPLGVRLYNRTYIPGKQSSVTVDFGAKVLKNRIQVVTPGTNFRRQVLVEGSDDGTSWQKVREGAFLFRVGADQTREGYDKDSVSLPENDQRYLRVTVCNGPDDPKQVEVQDVRAWQQVVVTPLETFPVGITSREVVENAKNKTTEITLDLSYRNLPLHEMALRFTDADFYRHVGLSGRNVKERIVKAPVEDSPELEKKVEEPWTGIAGGTIYRYSSGGSADELLALNLQGARYRYLLVQIENRDDPPLHLDGVQATRLAYYLAFPPKGPGGYSLYFGNPRASRPSYDIEHYADRVRKQGVLLLNLGKVIPNPAYTQAEKVVPWSEQHKAIIWIALLAGAAVLLLLVYRMAKSVPASEGKG